MSETFVFRGDPKFIFYTNYKVMFSSLFSILHKHFPTIERNTEETIPDLSVYLKLGIVRNPYSRFVSLYVDKCLYDPAAKLSSAGGIFLQPVQGQILEELSMIRGHMIAIARTWEDLTHDPQELQRCRENFEILRTIRFDEFVAVAQRILRRERADPHFHPQHRRFFHNNYSLLDFLFRLEVIEHDWARICKLLNTQMYLEHKNKTACQPLVDFYSNSRLANAVYWLYREDFTRFSYDRDVRHAQRTEAS